MIRGERKEDREDKQKDSHRVEWFSGPFYRGIPRSLGVEKDKITATHTDGMVTVTIPNAPQAQPRTIAVVPKQ